jgi:hypothetical protein
MICEMVANLRWNSSLMCMTFYYSFSPNALGLAIFFKHYYVIHGFSKGPSWLTSHFSLMEVYILITGQELEWHVFFTSKFD